MRSIKNTSHQSWNLPSRYVIWIRKPQNYELSFSGHPTKLKICIVQRQDFNQVSFQQRLSDAHCSYK